MKHISRLLAFNMVVSQGSLTSAADKLDLPKSTLSRHISQLETELGVQLLNRSGRTLKPTEAGLRLYSDTEIQLAQIDEAMDRLDIFHNQPTGLLKIQAPVEFMTEDMAQILVEFRQRYPEIELCYTQYSGRPDFQSGCDITLVTHSEPLPNSDLVARPLMSLPQGLYCSRIQQFPDQLPIDSIPGLKLITQSDELQWSFRQGQHRISIAIASDLMIHSPSMRMIAAERSLGICKLPRYLAEPFVRKGSLFEIRTEFPLWATSVSIIYAHRQPARRIQVFTDFLQSNIGILQSRL